MEIIYEVQVAINLLKQHNHEAYLVGGWLRDYFLERKSDDYDLCTSALVVEIREIFKDYQVIMSGATWGCVTVIINEITIQITTFRTDGQYLDYRKPNSVSFSKSLSEDLKRRDFTINTLAYNDDSGLIDLYGAKSDIENELICCVGDANQRFQEDALRMLRALRFASILNFTIEENTSRAIFTNKELLNKLSKERITKEFLLMIKGNNFNNIIDKYLSTLQIVIPELKPKLASYDFQDDNLNLVYLFKTYSNQELKQIITKRLIISKQSQKEILLLSECYYSSNVASREKVLSLLNKLQDKLFEKLILLWSLDRSVNEIIKVYQRVKDQCYLTKDLEIDGNDLKELGYQGALIGQLKELLLILVIKGKLVNKKTELINYIKETLY